jgi:hypothetical protein
VKTGKEKREERREREIMKPISLGLTVNRAAVWEKKEKKTKLAGSV